MTPLLGVAALSGDAKSGHPAPAVYWPPLPCQARGCEAYGIPFAEPAGVWCLTHLPILWKPGSARQWATPRCHKCGQPGAYPSHRNMITRPACRDHAPAWMRPYLIPTTAKELTA